MTGITDPQIKQLRDEIRRCDIKILGALSLRFALCAKIGARKKELGLEVLDSSREADILETYKTITRSTPLESLVAEVFPAIFKVSRNIQQRIVKGV